MFVKMVDGVTAKQKHAGGCERQEFDRSQDQQPMAAHGVSIFSSIVTKRIWFVRRQVCCHTITCHPLSALKVREANPLDHLALPVSAESF